MNGEELGTIGVLGPTRMNYPKALAAVRLVGEELAERLGQVPGRRPRGEQPWQLTTTSCSAWATTLRKKR